MVLSWGVDFLVQWGEGGQGPWWAEVKGSLTETEEQCIHTHAVDAEEAMCDQVGANDHRLFKRRHCYSSLQLPITLSSLG